jgi:thiol-disulfide isomerase/thioredoxin
MRVFLILLMVLCHVSTAQAWKAPEQPKAQIFAVYFSAKWCPNCHILSPIIAQARTKGELDTKPIVFITLDLTDKSTIYQSQMLASALGLGDYLAAQGSSTGYLALVDASSKKELARFDSKATVDGMIREINKALVSVQAQ